MPCIPRKIMKVKGLGANAAAILLKIMVTIIVTVRNYYEIIVHNKNLTIN